MPTYTLRKRLEQWRDATGGEGAFEIQVHHGARESRRGIGIVQITVHHKRNQSSAQVNDVGLQGVQALIDALVKNDVLPTKAGENLYLATDFFAFCGNSAYFIKPLANRLWRASQASRDARHLVDAVARGKHG